ncbi:hypothetical protein BI364_10950 [Acidihalobacter yilgarnensis]|uniref:Transmembrane protein n=1 Tax=Acidihalobacter yilgarnensis TaxID=2819280 RepID=A0A1D8IPM7_9GAMM|nr:hypothetical protein [Acidihalobacter yilgarnensis]AOU98407.1 hypothetical protein BI364_10950 [Acidihalobacter yilgarnensis]
MTEVTADQTKPNTAGTAKIIYILYLIGLVLGITGLIGVVMAYVNKGDAPEWLATHYRFQIRTFWIGSLYLVIGGLLSLVIIGYLILLFWAIWLIVRCVKGMKALEQQVAPANPGGWFF